MTVAVLVRPARDARLDVLRGWMQVSIFISHSFGSVFAWAIHASWGASDSSEQFMLLSGVALGSVFALKRVRDGFATAWRDMWQRAQRLWLTHLVVFFAFAAVVLSAGLWAGLPGDVEILGWTWLTREPWFAVPAAATMLYQPAFMDILPVFVWCMLALPGFLWLLERCGDRALAVPLGLYAAAQFFGLGVPGFGGWPLGFEPLCWQVLFMLGAWLGQRTLLGAPPLPRPAMMTAGALIVVALGIWLRTGEAGLLPPAPPILAELAYKPSLAPFRLLHALSLAWLVTLWLPRPGAWVESAPGRLLATIGRQGLNVFCLGLFLSWAVHAAFRLWPGHKLALDLALVPAGIALLWLFARSMEHRRGATRRYGAASGSR